ncbi:MAG: NYN domain-containing protein [Chloroflexia bacterium]
MRLLSRPVLSKYTVVVVFDGAPPAGEAHRKGRVQALYSWERTADEVIVEMCQASDVIATDDLALRSETLPEGPSIWSVDRLLGTVRPATLRSLSKQPQRETPPVEKRPTARVRTLRSFDVCPRCMFYTRDNWLMLCEEDGSLGRPQNYREGW